MEATAAKAAVQDAASKRRSKGAAKQPLMSTVDPNLRKSGRRGAARSYTEYDYDTE